MQSKDKKIYQSKLEQNKRIEEEKTLEELVKSQFPFVLRGSWAGEIISGIQSNHKDIDIYVLEKDWEVSISGSDAFNPSLACFLARNLD